MRLSDFGTTGVPMQSSLGFLFRLQSRLFRFSKDRLPRQQTPAVTTSPRHLRA